MYIGGITFHINKSFANLQLVPENRGLRIVYKPVINNVEVTEHLGFIDLFLPIDAVGGLWATTKAFLYAVESLDENIILQSKEAGENPNDILIKLYRDKPLGDQGKLNGHESCWLRIVNGRSEEERRRIKLGPRDLLCLELACQSVMTIAGATAQHNPQKIS